MLSHVFLCLNIFCSQFLFPSDLLDVYCYVEYMQKQTSVFIYLILSPNLNLWLYVEIIVRCLLRETNLYL